MIQQLSADDGPLMNALLGVSGEAFNDTETYGTSRPRPANLRQLLDSDHFIALMAREGARGSQSQRRLISDGEETSHGRS